MYNTGKQLNTASYLLLLGICRYGYDSLFSLIVYSSYV